MSEHISMSSRHRRKSVPHSFASGILGSTHSGRGSTSRRARSSTREGSIDPLLLGDGGSYSDGEDSTGNRMSTGTLPLSVSRTELDRYIRFCIKKSSLQTLLRITKLNDLFANILPFKKHITHYNGSMQTFL